MRDTIANKRLVLLSLQQMFKYEACFSEKLASLGLEEAASEHWSVLVWACGCGTRRFECDWEEEDIQTVCGTELWLSKSLLYVLSPWSYSDFYWLSFYLVIPERDCNLIW